MATANDDATFPAHTQLWTVTVGTAAASAVVTVYNGTATTDEVKAVIDASAVGQYRFYGARFPNGLYVQLTAGNAKVSVGAH